jgi:KDO2-lipid IV(A) lauroyltransferase
MWLIISSRRKRAITSIMKHLNISKTQAKSLARENFSHIGRSFAEILFNLKVDHRFLQERVRIKNIENLHLLKNTKRPVVAVTGHLGAWELLSGIMAVLFPDRATQIVVREPDDLALRDVVLRLRKKYTHEIVPRDNSAPNILRCLKNNGISAFLVDHNCGAHKAVFLPFLGEIAAVNFGPALMAIRSRAMVWPIFLVRSKNNTYLLYFNDPLDTLSLKGNIKDKIKQITQFYTKEVEKMVLKYPAQWYWIHNRWRTRPRNPSFIKRD